MSAPIRFERSVLRGWQRELQSWSSVAAFQYRLKEIKGLIPSSTFFDQAGFQFLRDAWIGARVATALPAIEMRLCGDERPDFEIRTRTETRLFEATEADLPGRRRGSEYRDLQNPIAPDPVEKWRNRFEAIEPSVATVVGKKLSKKYDTATNLIIYVNLGCYGAYVDEGVPILREQTRAAKDAFQEIFVLWEGIVYSFWKAGHSNSEKWNVATLDDF